MEPLKISRPLTSPAHRTLGTVVGLFQELVLTPSEGLTPTLVSRPELH